MARFLTFTAALLLAPGLAAAPPPGSWERELGEWRSRRHEELTAPDGWLALVGRFWLHEGTTRFGSSPANEAVVAGAPPLVGTLEVRQGAVEFVAAPGVAVTEGGRAVSRLPLAADRDGKPTVLETGTLSFHLIRRGERIGLRVRDRESPRRRDFKGLEYFPADPSWRVEARLEAAAPGATVEVPNVLGQLEPTPTPGRLVFTLGGAEHRLTALAEPGADELFIVFGDKTNGRETYGGGRFLYAPVPGPDGRTTLDFNRAENPPCALTPFATCPLPPRGNKLPVRVEAGEKVYGAGHP